MKKKEKQPPPLPPEIFKNMKTGKEINAFLNAIYKQGVEALLNTEMDELLQNQGLNIGTISNLFYI
jgi:hypothetical protein